MRQLAFFFAFVLMLGGASFAEETPAVQAKLAPWLQEAEALRAHVEASGLTLRRAGITETRNGLRARLTPFILETAMLSKELRSVEGGEEPACILKGMALDLDDRLARLNLAKDHATAIVEMAGIERLLLEAKLIFLPQKARARPQGGAASFARPISATIDLFKNEPDCSGLPADGTQHI